LSSVSGHHLGINVLAQQLGLLFDSTYLVLVVALYTLNLGTVKDDKSLQGVNEVGII
jgi:hypothetical protein